MDNFVSKLELKKVNTYKPKDNYKFDNFYNKVQADYEDIDYNSTQDDIDAYFKKAINTDYSTNEFYNSIIKSQLYEAYGDISLYNNLPEPIKRIFSKVENVVSEIREKNNLGEYLKALGISTVVGLLQPIEQTVDCTVQAVAEVAWLGNRYTQFWNDLLGFKNLSDSSEKISSWIEEKTKWFVGTNWGTELTNKWIDSIDESGMEYRHQLTSLTRAVEDGIGSAMLTKLPGPWAAIATAVTNEGRTAEISYQQGADFWGAAGTSHLAGGLSFVSGGLMGKVGKAAQGSTSVKEALKYAGQAAGCSVVGDTVRSAVNYAAYGNKQQDESGNKLYKNFGEYFAKNDAVQTAFGGATAFGSTAFQGIRASKQYKKLVTSQTYKDYENKVYEKNIDDTKYDNSKALGINKEDIVLTELEEQLAMSNAQNMAERNAKIIHKQSASGIFKDGVTSEDAFRLMSNGNKQETIYNEKFLNNYRKAWNSDKDGTVEVITLKSGKAYDNFVVNENSIGRPDGEFVMPVKEAEKILKKAQANGVIDYEKLSKALSLPPETFNSGVVLVKQTVNIDDISLPISSQGGSMLGEWVPGGKTAGGITEGTVAHLKKNGDYWYTNNGKNVKVEIKDYR